MLGSRNHASVRFVSFEGWQIEFNKFDGTSVLPQKKKKQIYTRRGRHQKSRFERQYCVLIR